MSRQTLPLNAWPDRFPQPHRRPFTVAEAARRVGISPRRLRYLDSLGVRVPVARRSLAARYRYYERRDIARLRRRLAHGVTKGATSGGVGAGTASVGSRMATAAATRGGRFFTMAEATRLLGVHENTIRYAERDGRVRRALRDELGHRAFTEAHIEYLRGVFRTRS